jgi:hypothetical protein
MAKPVAGNGAGSRVPSKIVNGGSNLGESSRLPLPPVRSLATGRKTTKKGDGYIHAPS